MRCLARTGAGFAAIALVIGGLSLVATPHADAMTTDHPVGTRGLGNSYVILWVKPDPALNVRSVRIAGRWARPQGDGYWDVVMTGPFRNLPMRRVEVHAKTGVWAGPVRFTEVPW